jgi:glycosyltransferase involved in cell wall biosynthesis
MLRTEIKNFDVVHVHLARDFVTLPSARMALKARVPLVAQCHGMVDVSDKLLAKPVDRFWTRKVLTSAHRVLYLTNTERERVAELAGDAVRFAFVPNGVPEYNMVDSSVSDDHAGPEVLFLARLHPRKRPEMFAKVGGVLLAEGVKARFTIIGPDGGSEEAVDRQISTQSILGGQTVRRMPAISPEDCATRIAQATIYVLPSINEPYPMSVLEAMSVGRPVIVTESCGLASAVKQHRCGVVVGESEDELRVAVRYLLTHKVEAEEMGRRGQDAVRRVFGMKPVVTKLEAVYSAASTSVESLLDEATCKTAQSDGK